MAKLGEIEVIQAPCHGYLKARGWHYRDEMSQEDLSIGWAECTYTKKIGYLQWEIRYYYADNRYEVLVNPDRYKYKLLKTYHNTGHVIRFLNTKIEPGRDV